MRKIGVGVAALSVGLLVAAVPALAAQATGNGKPHKPGPAKLSAASACVADGWTATFTFTNRTRKFTAEVVKVKGAADPAVPFTVAPGASWTQTVTLPLSARRAELDVWYAWKRTPGQPPSDPPTGVPSDNPTPPDDDPTPPDETDPTPPDDGEPSGGTEGGDPGQGVEENPAADAAARTGGKPHLHHRDVTVKRPRHCPTTPPSDTPTPPDDEEPSSPPSSGGPSEDPDPSEEPSTPPTAPDDDPTKEPVGNELPLTGAPVAFTVAAAAGLIAAGIGAVLLVRRRRSFES